MPHSIDIKFFKLNINFLISSIYRLTPPIKEF